MNDAKKKRLMQELRDYLVRDFAMKHELSNRELQDLLTDFVLYSVHTKELK